MYFHDATGTLRRLPAGWTDVVPDDPFVVIATGRSHFRMDDLRELVALVARLNTARGEAANEP